MTTAEVFHQPMRWSTAIPVSAGGFPGTLTGAGEVLPPPKAFSKARNSSAGADFADLRIWAESYWDTQENRMALVNRMKRGGVDGDLLEGHKSLLDASEGAFKLSMIRSYRRAVREHMPAVEEWQKTNFGIGEPLTARLIGVLGHPVHATPYVWMDDSPEGHECIEARCGKRHLVALQPFNRTVRQLWSYCGHGAPLRRRKGMTQDEALGLGSPRCKTLVYLLATGTIKCGPQPIPRSPARSSAAGAATFDSGTGSIGLTTAKRIPDRYRYRNIYDTRKASTIDRTDDKDKPWTDGHRHADALRIVGKEILRDLWKAAGGGQ